MRSLLVRNHKVSKQNSAGFTLVEMMVVAPIAILAVAAIVSAVIGITGDALVSQNQAAIAHDAQDALDRIEQDVRLSSAFLSTFNSLQPGQGKNATTTNGSDTTPFNTTNGDLILNQTATSSNPYDSTRSLVYYANQPNACGAANTYMNRTLTTRVIYFLQGNTLWRRTIVPNWNTNTGSSVNINTVCSKPWQRDNCPRLFNSDCQAVDEKIINDVASLSITYYTPSGTATTNSRNANNLSVNLALSKSVAGKIASYDSRLRATRTNESMDNVPARPTVSVLNPSINTDNNPTRITFGWDVVPYTGYYNVSYRVNGGAWTNTTTTDSSFVVTPLMPNDVVNINVTAVNDLGSSPTGSATATVPVWTRANLEGDWQCYQVSSTYQGCPSYTLLSSGLVLVSGMAKAGAVNSTIFTLPPGLRPHKSISWGNVINNAPTARVQVNADGRVMHAAGGTATSWMSLENVRFMRSGSITWNSVSLLNGWTNISGGSSAFGVTQYAIDSMKRVHINGTVIQATATSGTQIFNLPAGYTERNGRGIMPGARTSSGSGPFHIQISSNLNYAIERGMGTIGASAGIGAFFISNTNTDTLTNPALTNAINYADVNFANAGYIKSSDNLVMLQGLIEPTTTTGGAVLFVLPADKRPSKRLVFMVADAGTNGTAANLTTARIDVFPNGEVQLWNKSVAGYWTSLEGISFLAE